MPGSPDTFLWTEQYTAVRGLMPTEIAPRLVIIDDMEAGRPGLYASPATRSLEEMRQEYSADFPSYGEDFMRVFMRQVSGAMAPAAVDIVNVADSAAVLAQTQSATDGAGTPVDQFYFEAIGPGTRYNQKTVRIVCKAVIATGHPAGANTSVCDVFISPPNSSFVEQVFQNIVFTKEGGLGTSSFHNTRDAITINDPGRLRIARLVYEATANGGFKPVLGSTTTLTFAGGTEGTVDDSDWEAAIDAAVALPFRWFVIPNAPSEAIRGYFAEAVKSAPYGLGFYGQMYGESAADFNTARLAYGNGPDSGKIAGAYGWGSHPLASAREVPAWAAYLGRWSAKINAGGLGAGYPVGNNPLGYSSIAFPLTRTQQVLLATSNINYMKQLDSGGIGVHGFWTNDTLIERMGDLGVRAMFNDIIRLLAVAFTEFSQSVGNSPATRALVTEMAVARLQPYISAGFLERAQLDTFTYNEVLTRFAGISVPFYENWAYLLASLKFYGTLAGLYAYITDAEIEGLRSVLESAGTEGGSEGEGE